MHPRPAPQRIVDVSLTGKAFKNDTKVYGIYHDGGKRLRQKSDWAKVSGSPKHSIL